MSRSARAVRRRRGRAVAAGSRVVAAVWPGARRRRARPRRQRTAHGTTARRRDCGGSAARRGVGATASQRLARRALDERARRILRARAASSSRARVLAIGRRRRSARRRAAPDSPPATARCRCSRWPGYLRDDRPYAPTTPRICCSVGVVRRVAHGRAPARARGCTASRGACRAARRGRRRQAATHAAATAPRSAVSWTAYRSCASTSSK